MYQVWQNKRISRATRQQKTEGLPALRQQQIDKANLVIFSTGQGRAIKKMLWLQR
jgi:hypothetical protein